MGCDPFSPENRAMKRSVTTGGGGWVLLTEDDVEIAGILLSLPILQKNSVVISGCCYNWGRKKKRSGVESPPSPAIRRRIDEGSPENVTAEEARKSPTTPLCFLPRGGGIDGGDGGGDKRKPQSSVRKTLKGKATDSLMEVYNRMREENEVLIKKLKEMEALHQKRTTENLEPKARGQKINYSRNKEGFHIWNGSMKAIDQQCSHHQTTMFAPSTPQQHPPQQQQLVAVSCNGGAGAGGGSGLFNQIDPRVKIHGETSDFMGASQPLDQSKYLKMDNDLRVRAAAAARKRRILRMKESKNSLLSRGCR